MSQSPPLDLINLNAADVIYVSTDQPALADLFCSKYGRAPRILALPCCSFRIVRQFGLHIDVGTNLDAVIAIAIP